jgi:7-cyano-7-deazaguanine synthase
MKKAVVLLSGGLDSAVTLYRAKAHKYKCFCLTFDYGQRHKKEIISARAVAGKAACPLFVFKTEFPWKGSALLDRNIKIPRHNSTGKISGIPPTYVPARNTIFLSIALSYAEAIGASAIFIGANAIDFSGYPDCRPDYYAAFRKMAKLGTKCGTEGKPVGIITPLIRKTKAQIIEMGKKLKVPLELTWSCYAGGKKPCGKCDACLIREKGFTEEGIRRQTNAGKK